MHNYFVELNIFICLPEAPAEQMVYQVKVLNQVLVQLTKGHTKLMGVSFSQKTVKVNLWWLVWMHYASVWVIAGVELFFWVSLFDLGFKENWHLNLYDWKEEMTHFTGLSLKP